jgi:hypothetical protein
MSEKSDQRTGNIDPQTDDPHKGESRVSLSTPWKGDQCLVIEGTSNVMSCHDQTSLADFVDRRSQVHETYIREQAKNKRIGLILAFALILGAAVLLTFAPEGRQTISYWIGAALLVFAAGGAGFGRVWGKTKTISFGADQDRRGLGK